MSCAGTSSRARGAVPGKDSVSAHAQTLTCRRDLRQRAGSITAPVAGHGAQLLGRRGAGSPSLSPGLATGPCCSLPRRLAAWAAKSRVRPGRQGPAISISASSCRSGGGRPRLILSSRRALAGSSRRPGQQARSITVSSVPPARRLSPHISRPRARPGRAAAPTLSRYLQTDSPRHGAPSAERADVADLVPVHRFEHRGGVRIRPPRAPPQRTSWASRGSRSSKVRPITHRMHGAGELAQVIT